MRPTLKHLSLAGMLAGAMLIGICSPSSAGKPDVISMAANTASSNTYAEITAIGNAINAKFGTKIRAIPIGNAMGRAIALMTGKAKFWMSCSAYYTTFQGIGDFAVKKWGPQRLRILILVNRDANFSPAVSKDSPVNSIADLKGKRVSWVVGNSGINMQTEAYLAFGGLTLKDVELVEFAGYGPSVMGLSSGQVDMTMAANSSPVTLKVAASPSGLKWVPIPTTDKAGWEKVQKLAPFVRPQTITRGPGVAEGQSFELGGYPCPTFVTKAQEDAEIVYWMTKMTIESWDGYRNSVKSAPFWHIDTAITSKFAVPYHEGSVRYYKEIGKWSDQLEAQQQVLLKREKALQAAFEQAKAEFKGDDSEFAGYWQKKQAEALAAVN